MVEHRFLQLFGPNNYLNKEIHSDIFAYLLNPDSVLGTSLLEQFVNMSSVNFNDLQMDFVSINREWVLSENLGRIDIFVVIQTKNKTYFTLVIENKLLSSEHSDQLDRYSQYISNRSDLEDSLLILLSPNGVQPTNTSFMALSYKTMANWISECLQINKVETTEMVLIDQYVQLIRGKLVPGIRADFGFQAEVASKLKELIIASEAIQIDSTETYRSTWIGLLPDAWNNSNELMQLKTNAQIEMYKSSYL